MDRVKNIVTKEEIAHNEQFLLLSRCFQMSPATKASKGADMWEWVKAYRYGLLQSVYIYKHSPIESLNTAFTLQS